MEYILLILTIVAAHALAVISPGPDFIVVVKNTLTYSRRTGIWTAVGIGAGIMVHIVYSLAGLAVIISQSILVFTLIKYAGAVYLLYLGYQLLRAKGSPHNQDYQIKQEVSRWRAIREGFLTNALNPKATLFFLSLFTVVISAETPFSVLLVASVIVVINTTMWFVLVLFLLSAERTRRAFLKYENPINKFLGGALVLLGIKVATSSNS